MPPGDIRGKFSPMSLRGLTCLRDITQIPFPFPIVDSVTRVKAIMAPEFFPIFALIALAVVSLIGMVVGGFLVLATRRNKKRRVISALVLGGSFLLALFVYLCIPSTPRTAQELYGTYVLDCDLVHEQMVLNPDGTFTQTVSIKATGEKISSEGKWTYQTRKSNGLIFGDVTFNDGFVGVLEWPNELRPDYDQSKSGGGVIPAEYYFGQLELGGRVDSWPQWKKVY